MMTKVEYERALALLRDGLTRKEAAQRLGYHPATLAKWIRAGGPPEERVKPADAYVLNPQWTARISDLLAEDPRMFGTHVHNRLAAEGFSGSYASVVRHLRARRGPRHHTTGAPTCTPP